MKKINAFFFLLCLSSSLLFGQTTNSTSDGNWTDPLNWDNGVPAAGGTATITDSMTLDTDLSITGSYIVNNGFIIDNSGGPEYDLTVSGSGNFEIGGNATFGGDMLVANNATITIKGCDTLTIEGNVEVRNSSNLIVESCAVFIIEGNALFRNSGTSLVDGNILIKGNLTSRNSATMTGTGNMEVIGTSTISNPSTVFGSTTPCSPNPCSYGPGGGLPIELLSFKTYLTPNGTVNIGWVTISEINNEYFTIERADNDGSFQEISRIEGAGNSQQQLSYQYTDDTPLKGYTYYRLKQTDFDGKFTYFDPNLVIADQFSINKELKLFPNPANQLLTVENPFEGTYNYRIMNSTGALVSQNIISNGTQFLQVDLSSLPHGLYLIQLQLNDSFTIKTGKFLIAR